MKTLVTYLKNYWKLCLVVVLVAAVNQIASLIDPLIFQKVIDIYVMHVKEFTFAEFLHGIIKYLLLGVGIVFVARVAKNLQDYYLNTVVQKVGADLYTNGIERSLNLPFESFENEKSGGILSVLQKARTDVEKFLTITINVAFISFIGFLFVSIYAFVVNWVIGVMFLVTAPVVGFISYLLSKKVKAMQTKIVGETAALAGNTTESLRNIELIKSLGLSKQEIAHLNSTTQKILALELNKLRYIRSISFIQGTIINLLRTTIIAVMLVMVWKETLTFGQVWSLLIYSFYLFGPLQELGSMFAAYSESSASLAKFEEVINKPVEVIPENAVSLDTVTTISFDDVSFGYASSKDNALSNISFETNSGKTIAFVGPSGSGKTSLVKLLVGLYQPTSGTVSYNQTSGSAIDLDSLRSQIGFVTQDTQLFAGTIRENMLFVKPDSTDEEILDCLHRSSCDTLLSRAEKGLDTTIGESGMKLSGGERQRLSIARALLRKPSILVFDEATSALDSITEEEITKTIRDVSQTSSTTTKPITILIAHRLSTIMHADTIYVLEKGTMVESGTHEKLLSEKGLYYAMWRQQIGERL